MSSSVGCSRFGPNDEVETSPVETPRPQVKTSVATSFRQTKREASPVLADGLRPLRAVPWADRDSSFLPARLDDGSRQGRRGSNELDALLFVRDSLLRKVGQRSKPRWGKRSSLSVPTSGLFDEEEEGSPSGVDVRDRKSLRPFKKKGPFRWSFLFLSFPFRPQIRREYPLNLSISLRGGKETNKDSPSNGE